MNTEEKAQILKNALERIYNATLDFETDEDEAEQAINLIDMVNQMAQQAIASAYPETQEATPEQICPTCDGDGYIVRASGIGVECPDCGGLGI